MHYAVRTNGFGSLYGAEREGLNSFPRNDGPESSFHRMLTNSGSAARFGIPRKREWSSPIPLWAAMLRRQPRYCMGYCPPVIDARLLAGSSHMVALVTRKKMRLLSRISG